MPTYDYECQSCGHRFDQFQSMSEDPLRDCPSCGEPELKRLVGGGIGIIFKGSGFYVTDSKSSGSSKKSEPKKADADSSGNSGDSGGAGGTGGSKGASGSSGDASSSSGSTSKTEAATQKAG